MKNKFSLGFKYDVKPGDLMFLTHNCNLLFVETLNYCQKNSLPVVVTSLISDRVNVEAVSRTHEEGRAFDLSTQDWSKNQIIDFCDYLNKNYKNVAAISASDLKPRAAIYHDSGYGHHIHVQVRRDGT